MHSSSPRALRRWGFALLAALGVACAPSHEPAAGASPGQPAAREVHLSDGSTVRVRSQAQHVLPASSSVVDFVLALAPPERVAGLPEQALEYSTLGGQAFDASGGWAKVPRFVSFLAEDVIALGPDLVIAQTSQDKNTLERLTGAGIEVVVLPEVRTWQEARASLISVGGLLGLEERAAELALDLDRRVALLAERAGTRGGLRVLCYSNFGSSGWSAGIHTTIHEQIVLAGMRNAVAEQGRDGHVQIGFEDLIALDPDVILVQQPLIQAAGSQGDRGGASERLLRSEPALRGLRAVISGRIVALPPRLFATNSHEIVSGAEVLAAAIDDVLARTGVPREREE